MNKQIWIADGDKNRLSIYKKILSQHPDKTFKVKTFQSVQKGLKSFSFAESIPLCIFDDDTAFSEAVNTVRSLQSVSSGTTLLLLFSEDQTKSSEPHRLLQDSVYHLKKPVSDDVLHAFADSLIASPDCQ